MSQWLNTPVPSQWGGTAGGGGAAARRAAKKRVAAAAATAGHHATSAASLRAFAAAGTYSDECFSLPVGICTFSLVSVTRFDGEQVAPGLPVRLELPLVLLE